MRILISVKHLEECLTYSKHQISVKCYCVINNKPSAHGYTSEMRCVFVTEVGTVGLGLPSNSLICNLLDVSRPCLLSGPIVRA